MDKKAGTFQKRYCTSKDKKKPDKMVRESHLWYNKFNIQTHKLENNYITEVLTQGREFRASSQAPQGRGLVLTGRASRALGFPSTGAWLQEFHRTGGWTPHVEGAPRSYESSGPGQRQDLKGDWAGPTCWSWRVSCGSRGQLWLSLA